MSSTVRIQDSDPSVQYSSSQWITDPFTLASGGSRHGAALEGLTVTLQFHGTGIQVVGILDASVNDGQATTMYTLDGADVKTYTAPWTEERTFDVVYYQKQGLQAGDHTIEVTNVNGTSPNIFWLDYFLVDVGPSSNTTVSTTSAPSKSSAPSSSSSSPSSTPSSTPSSPSIPPSSPVSHRITVHSSSTTSTSTHSTFIHSNMTAIAPPSIGTTSTSTGTAAQTDHVTSIISPPSSGSSSIPTMHTERQGPTSSRTNQVAKVAGSVGGVMGLLLVVVIAVSWWQLRRRRAELREPSIFTQETPSFTGTAFSRPHLDTHYCKVHGCFHPTHHADASVIRTASWVSELTSSPPGRSLDGRRMSVPASPNIPSASDSGGALPVRCPPSSPQLEFSPDLASEQLRIPEPESPFAAAGTTPSAMLRAEVATSPWHVPPEHQLDARSLLRAISARERRRRLRPIESPSGHMEEMDSGLRMYTQDLLPPRYTPD